MEGSVSGTQPTTPLTKSFCAATDSSQSVSSSVCRACTETTPPTRALRIFSFQVGREKIASNDAHLIINPPLLRCGVFPKVLMSVNFHPYISFT
jgi:hypothetical protein